MIYVNEKKAILCKGDFRPAQFYKGKKKIAGYERVIFEGNGTVTLENCYNDRLHNAKIYGNTIQDGEPSPDNPVEMQSVGDLVTEGEHSGKYKIGVIARGKNLFDSDLWLPYFDKLEDGSYKSKQHIPSGNRVAINLPAGQYTMSIDVMCESEKNYRPCLYDADGNRLWLDIIYSNGDWQHAEWSFTLTKDATAMGWYYSAQSNQLYFKNFQIESGGNATEFDEFKEPQTFDIFLDEPLRKVGEYEDYVDFEKGVVVRNTAKKVFDGTEHWSLDPTISNNGFRFIEYVDEYTPASSKSISALSNRVKALKWDALWQNYYKTENTDLIIGICVVYSTDDGSGKPSSYIKLTPYSTLPTVEEWKAQLAKWYAEGNPFTVLYAKATTEEPTDLSTLLQFKGATVCEINTNISARISGEYKKVIK